jgi:hypothetical protein
VRPGERRNAELSRSAIVLVAGAAILGLSRQAAAGVPPGPMGTVALVAGGAVVAVGLMMAIRAVLRRSGDAE